MAGTLYIRPRLGLCNRWRTILSAIGVARKTDRQVRIWWERLGGVNCPITELFDFPDEAVQPCSEAEFNAGAKHCPGFAGHVLARRRTPVPLEGDVAVSSFCVFGHELCEPISQWLPQLPVAPRLVAQAEQFYQERLARHAQLIGVAVRTTNAHGRTRRQTPLRWFVERMREIAAAYPEVWFLAAPDSWQAMKALEAAVPGRVIVYPRQTYKPYSPAIPVDALVNILLLAKLPYLLGAHWSSYAAMPTLLNPALVGEWHPADARTVIPFG